MSNISLEKHLADIFESRLREFLSIPILGRLEKVNGHFNFENKELGLALKKYTEFVKHDIQEMTDEEKENYFRDADNNLRHYLSMFYQDLFTDLPYFIWTSHLILNETYSSLTYEAKEELRQECNLETPKKRKDACLNFFDRFIYEKVVDGGSETLWNKWNRLYFLSLYERFSVLIENARNDIKTMKQQKIAVMDIKKEVLEKYSLPEHLWNEVAKQSNSTGKLARSWASKKMQKGIKKEHLEKMGFADSHLVKVLGKARVEAMKHIHCKCKTYENHKLIFFTFGIPDIQHIGRLNKAGLAELKFDSFVQDDKHFGMALYFIG